jgi:hypothetical protein
LQGERKESSNILEHRPYCLLPYFDLVTATFLIDTAHCEPSIGIVAQRPFNEGVDPSAGGTSSEAHYILPSIRDALFANVLAVVGADVQLLVSALGKDAVAFGGVALAMEDFLPLPSSSSLTSLPTASKG